MRRKKKQWIFILLKEIIFRDTELDYGHYEINYMQYKKFLKLYNYFLIVEY